MKFLNEKKCFLMLLFFSMLRPHYLQYVTQWWKTKRNLHNCLNYHQKNNLIWCNFDCKNIFWVSAFCRMLQRPVAMETKCASHKLLLIINSKYKRLHSKVYTFLKRNMGRIRRTCFCYSGNVLVVNVKLRATGSASTLQHRRAAFMATAQVHYLQPFLSANARI